jgi:hypothetical protein
MDFGKAEGEFHQDFRFVARIAAMIHIRLTYGHSV